MKKVLHEDYKPFESTIDSFVQNFDSSGTPLGDAARNSIKLFPLGEQTLNIKSFKVPNLLNQVVYRFFRKSKARRSYEYANRLVGLGIGTPVPIAYYEFPQAVLFRRSFYVSEHLDYDITFRTLSHQLDYPDHEKILRAFTRFTYGLHENKVLFLDHSPGNTLIKKTNDGYEFNLVDLNRMAFRSLDFKTRIKNFERLTIHKSMVEVMSEEYAKCSGESFDEIFELMWSSTQAFQKKFHRKKRLKKKLKFWK